MQLVLDTGVLGQLCHPNKDQNRPVSLWMANLLRDHADRIQVLLPEIADYELRRKLLHLIAKRQATKVSTDRLDNLATLLDYLPLNTETMRRAAALWATARSRGNPTSADMALDGDVILASQAIEVGGIIVTTNPKHLSRFTTAYNWFDLPELD